MLKGGSETAINAVKATKADDAIYNLNGQRVNASYKGLVIKNGKKVVIKWEKWELARISERERARTKFKVLVK